MDLDLGALAGTDVARLSDAELMSELTTWAGRVAAGEAVLLELVGELDARGAWAQHGVVSCAHWLMWRLSMSLGTARDRVRVARALRELPVVASWLRQGRLSYSQVRAIVRVAVPGDEQRWVDLARHCTAAQLEQAVRGVNRARRSEQGSPRHAPAVRMRWDDDGSLLLTVRVAAHQAPGVLAVLEQAQQAEQADRDARLRELAVELASGATSGVSAETPTEQEAADTSVADVADGTGAAADPGRVSAEAPIWAAGESPPAWVFQDPPYPVLQPRVGLFEPRRAEDEAALEAYWAERKRRQQIADAWRAEQDQLAQEAAARDLPVGPATLADGLVRALTRPDRGKAVTVRLLVDPVSGWARTRRDELLPPSTLTAVLRSLPGRGRQGRRVTPVDLRRHDLGRRARDASPALRALLGQVDGERCRFPGCTHTTNLHAHHVRFWSVGGPTDLANLVLLCSKHHRLIHDEGFGLELLADRKVRVRTPGGSTLPHHPRVRWGDPDELPAVGADTLPTDWTGEALDLGYVVNVLLQHAA